MHTAIIGLGEAGTLYAEGLLALGSTVAGYDPAEVPTPAGVRRCGTPEELATDADVVLCLVGGRAAVPAARSIADFLAPGTIFVDMNSASPATKLNVAEVVGAGRYADVGVVGSVPEGRAATAVVISGAASKQVAEIFRGLGAPVEDVAGLPGDAARYKLLRSSFMKGLGALIVETLHAGGAMNARDWVFDQIAAQHSGGGPAVERLREGTVKHAARRGAEAVESAEMLEDLGCTALMSRAAAAVHQTEADAAIMSRDELLDAYSSVPVANIGDAQERMGMVDGGIRPLWPNARAVGWARTVWTTAGDNLLLREALETVQPGDFLIVNGQGHTDRALMGELMAERARKRGAVGIVADAALRDRSDLEEMGFPAWARAVNPSGPYKNGPGQKDVPVAVGGVVVRPGDLVVGDDDGVVVVPAEEAAATLLRAREIQEDEARRRQAIVTGDAG